MGAAAHSPKPVAIKAAAATATANGVVVRIRVLPCKSAPRRATCRTMALGRCDGHHEMVDFRPFQNEAATKFRIPLQKAGAGCSRKLEHYRSRKLEHFMEQVLQKAGAYRPPDRSRKLEHIYLTISGGSGGSGGLLLRGRRTPRSSSPQAT